MTRRARTVQERRDATEARRARRAAVTERGVVMEAAAAFLAVRSRSVDETRRRLGHLGYPPALCDEVVDRLVAMRYLDDAAFARAWVESRDRARPRGAVALRRELQLKGVPDDTIAEVLEERGRAAAAQSGADEALPRDADLEAARRLIERRASSLRREADPRRRRQKAYALLARNGFTPDVCHEIASSVGREDPDEPMEGV
ncbi:MAG: regulatory protein RecX [Chloroflexota bacterium]|nr:regulatory protein RecX [Chloroflexota bacterium]